MNRYNPAEIEPKWQKVWDEEKTYQADLASAKPKYLAMSMFNYPSGAGIHIGHAMNYTISDVKARFKRQQGFESYHPVGWDAFGLPAENYAIKSGVSPQQSMATIIPGYHKQYKAMGWSNDWSKEITTHDPEYYKWTQWIFSEMYRNGLVYQDSRMQWWCEIDNTVLANEQIIDGKCWRHEGPNDPLVKQKEVKQWFFKITEYADELLDAIDALDWTDSVKLAQKNWIGKSIGAEVEFELAFADEQLSQNHDKPALISVFTTRPDTLYGATFLVLAPEHPWVEQALAHKTVLPNNDEVAAYVDASRLKSELERQANTKEKTGVELQDVQAVNPLTGRKIPMFVADYVLPGYGTGAIMAVPAHDERDHEFAQKFDLPITEVIEPVFGEIKGDEAHKDAIIAIVRDPKNGKVLTLDWGPRRENFGGTMFIGGGIEEGEDPVETAIREIAEETGYTSVKHIKTSDTFVNNYFYSNVKNKNYRARILPLLFELVDESKTELNLDHNEDQFTPKWVSEDNLEQVISEPAHLFGYQTVVKQMCYHGEGIMVNSGPYDGVDSSSAREQIVTHLERQGKGQEKVNYRMRDWSISRQRYWGAPIPIVYCAKDGVVLLPDDQLPVVLPELVDFQPSGDGRSALARATDWLNVTCPECGGPAERETDTLDTYICSSWYMFRYLDPRNNEKIFDSDVVNKWAPVDFYNGGDHATAHLLYARFVTRFFTKIGIMENPEPFKHMLYNGKVTAHDGSAFSKTLGNGIDPLEIINSGYGADALRTYLMFAAPLDVSVRWDSQGVPGTHRFLTRVWNLVQEYLAASTGDLDDDVIAEIRRGTHRMIKKMTIDIDENRYNTAIAAAMARVNELYKLKIDNLKVHPAWQEALESLVAGIGPFAPHAADELWHQLGNESSVQKDSWPTWDEALLVEDMTTVVVQVNGKVRAEILVAKEAAREDIESQALANERVREFMGGNEPKRIIYVPGRLVNIVV